MSMFDSIEVSYRPVIGFADNCKVCDGVVFRYGPVTDIPGKGMPQVVQDAQVKCHGHATYI